MTRIVSGLFRWPVDPVGGARWELADPDGTRVTINHAPDQPPQVTLRQFPLVGPFLGPLVTQVADLSIETAGFPFLTFEYRLPLERVRNARRLHIRLAVRARRSGRLNASFGARLASRNAYAELFRESVAIGPVWSVQDLVLDLEALPLDEANGPHASVPLLFEKAVNRIQFVHALALE